MKSRYTNMAPAVLLLMTLMPIVTLGLDDSVQVEEAGNAATEIIEYTSVLFECSITIESIEPSAFQHESIDLYFVTVRTDGIECEQAFDVLNRRGRNRGLYFALARDPESEDDYPAGTNLGLIHEIDPEVEH